MSETTHLVDTPAGPARLTIHARGPQWLVLGHGAGGLTWSADILAAAADAAGDLGWSVALVDQPWRVAGRKVATRPPVLDQGWAAALSWLRVQHHPQWLGVGGRSAGARVACRTAAAVAADAVLALSFPLHPPGHPERSRADELRTPLAAGLPVRVIQGARDPFGRPEEVRAVLPGGADVVEVPGTHTLAAPETVAQAVTDWLTRHTG